MVRVQYYEGYPECIPEHPGAGLKDFKSKQAVTDWIIRIIDKGGYVLISSIEVIK